MPKILITGSSGYLGRNLLKFSSDQYSIIAHYRHNLPEAYGRSLEYFQCDIASGEWPGLEKLDPDVIIHTAALGSLDECEMQAERAERVNFAATCQLAKFAAGRNCRFIFISSDVVFDGKCGNYRETDPVSPLNVYGRTKQNAENFILENHPNAVVVRPALFYGRALNGRPSFTEIMLNHLYDGKQVYAFTDQYRSPLLVNNLVSALWELANNSFCGIMHVGGPQRVNRLEIGKLLCQIFKLDENLLIPVKSADIKLPALRPLDCSLDCSLARSRLKTGFVDCETGLDMAYW